MNTLLTHCQLVLPDRVESDGMVLVRDGKIAYAGPKKDWDEIVDQQLDLGGLSLAPGFVDIHVHGGNGITFGEGDLAANTRAYSAWVAGKGVTGYLMSVASADKASLLDIIGAYVPILENPPAGAEPLGLHLEGPYLNPKRKGAFNPAWLREPSTAEAHEWITAAQGWIKQVTLATELSNAGEIARECRENGVVPALGHTDATYEIARAALQADFTHVTHTFNAQRGFDHREPGVVGAVLTSESATAEIIADMKHVHPAAVKLLWKCLGTERLVGVTDAMSAAGLADGEYALVGNPVWVKDGKATLADGTLAGSIATMDQCLANLVNKVGMSLPEAVRVVATNPARVIGLRARLGTLEAGKDASLTAFDGQFTVRWTMVRGEVCFGTL